MNQTNVFKIKEKFWTIGAKFTITDRNDIPKFQVVGEAFSWGDKLSFQDMNENEVGFINQRLMSWMPTYEISIGGEPFAVLKKEFSWFKQKFVLDVPGPNDYTIDGSFWRHDFVFTRAGKTVAKANKDYWKWTDSYGVEIGSRENVVAILASCIAIDQINHNESAGV